MKSIISVFFFFVFTSFSCTEEIFENSPDKIIGNQVVRYITKAEIDMKTDTTVYEVSSMDELLKTSDTYRFGYMNDDREEVPLDGLETKASFAQFIYYGDSHFTDYLDGHYIKMKFTHEMADHINQTHKGYGHSVEENTKYICCWRYQEVGVSLASNQKFGPFLEDKECGLYPPDKDNFNMQKKGYRVTIPSGSPNTRVLQTAVLAIIAKDVSSGSTPMFEQYFVPNPHLNNPQGFHYRYSILTIQ